MNSNAAIHLDRSDNVVVCCRQVRVGEVIDLGFTQLELVEDIDLGHKIAVTSLDKGAKIIKYGMPIGSATRAIAKGAWVHMHNMQSDYLNAHTRDTDNQQISGTGAPRK